MLEMELYGQSSKNYLGRRKENICSTLGHIYTVSLSSSQCVNIVYYLIFFILHFTIKGFTMERTIPLPFASILFETAKDNYEADHSHS